MENIEKLQEIIDNSNNIVFFGGAGVSTESGIPDFRSVDGLYNLKYKYPPEQIISHTFFQYKPEEFYRFYKDKMMCLDAIRFDNSTTLCTFRNKVFTVLYKFSIIKCVTLCTVV